MANKEFDDVQLDVEFTVASTRENITSEENIALSFGKLAKWYTDFDPIVWTGHTNVVTPVTAYGPTYFTYDSEGHFTGSSEYIHKAQADISISYYVKIATIGPVSNSSMTFSENFKIRIKQTNISTYDIVIRANYDGIYKPSCYVVVDPSGLHQSGFTNLEVYLDGSGPTYSLYIGSVTTADSFCVLGVEMSPEAKSSIPITWTSVAETLPLTSTKLDILYTAEADNRGVVETANDLSYSPILDGYTFNSSNTEIKRYYITDISNSKITIIDPTVKKDKTPLVMLTIEHGWTRIYSAQTTNSLVLSIKNSNDDSSPLEANIVWNDGGRRSIASVNDGDTLILMYRPDYATPRWLIISSDRIKEMTKCLIINYTDVNGKYVPSWGTTDSYDLFAYTIDQAGDVKLRSIYGNDRFPMPPKLYYGVPISSASGSGSGSYTDANAGYALYNITNDSRWKYSSWNASHYAITSEMGRVYLKIQLGTFNGKKYWQSNSAPYLYDYENLAANNYYAELGLFKHLGSSWTLSLSPVTTVYYFDGTSLMPVPLNINTRSENTEYGKKFLKWDSAGTITDSQYFIKDCAGTSGSAGWVRIADITITGNYVNQGIAFDVIQRGTIQYNVNVRFASSTTTDPDITTFSVTLDNLTTAGAPEVYMIKTDTSKWSIYIKKLDAYDHITIMDFDISNYTLGRLTWTWVDVHTAAAAITGGTAATLLKYVTTDANVLQSASATSQYRPILMGYDGSADPSEISDTVTNQVYTTSTVYAQPSTGNLYATKLFTNSYPSNAGACLNTYGLYLKAYYQQSGGSTLTYNGYAVRTYPGKNGDSNGLLLQIGGGGLTIIGSGEASYNLAGLISDDQSAVDKTTLNIGGTLNTAYHGSSEQMIVASDNNLYLMTNCNTIANRKSAVLSNSLEFYPDTDETGSIGTASYNWNTIYGKTIYEGGTALATKYAAASHTHEYIPLTGSDQVTGDIITTGTGRKFTVKNNTYSFSLHIGSGGVNRGLFDHGGDNFSGTNTWLINIDGDNETSIYSTIKEYTDQSGNFCIPFFGAAAATGVKKFYHNTGLWYNSKNGTTSAVGNAYLVLGNSSNSTTAGNKEGILRLYSTNTSYAQIKAPSTTTARTLTLPNATGTLALNKSCMIYEGSDAITDSNGWYKFAQATLSATSTDSTAIFLISKSWDSTNGKVPGATGILVAHIRTDNSDKGKMAEGSCELTWLIAGNKIDVNHFKLIHYDTTTVSTRAELWCRIPERYAAWSIIELRENSRTGLSLSQWTLYSYSGVAGTAFPSDYTGTVKISDVQTLLAGTV